MGSGPRKGKKSFPLVPDLIILVGLGVSSGMSEGDQGIFSLHHPLVFCLEGTGRGY